MTIVSVADDRELEDRIVVHGTAARELSPDRASWLVVLSETDDDGRAAFDRCAERAGGLVSALEQAVGPDGGVETGVVGLEPRWDHRRDRLIGHTARATVNVRTAVARAGAVVRVAIDAGADQLHGPRFSVDEFDRAGEELLADAVEQARRKADRVASAAARTLGPVLAVHEHQSNLTGRAPGIPSGAVARLAASGPEPPVEAPEQTLTVRVTATFALVD